MNKFDGVFNGEDVLIAVLVDVIHHCSQRRGLARARRPRDQYQPPWQHGEIAKHLSQPQILQRQHPGGDGTKDPRSPPVLIKRIDPKAGDTRHFKREICLQKLFIIATLFVVHDVVD